MGLQISSRQSGDVTILDLCGRSTINDGESGQLSGYLQRLVAGGASKLLLNLTNLTQIDSSGLSVLVTAYVSLRSRGGDLRFLCPRGRVLEVLTVLHLPQIIPCYENEAEALASFRPRHNLAQH